MLVVDISYLWYINQPTKIPLSCSNNVSMARPNWLCSTTRTAHLIPLWRHSTAGLRAVLRSWPSCHPWTTIRNDAPSWSMKWKRLWSIWGSLEWGFFTFLPKHENLLYKTWKCLLNHGFSVSRSVSQMFYFLVEWLDKILPISIYNYIYLWVIIFLIE